MFYARAKLAISTWSCLVWGAGVSEPTWWTYSSRVLERSAAYTLALLWDLLGRLNLSATTEVRSWSDAAPNFRNHDVMGTSAHQFTEHFRVNVSLCWGPEAHFKNPVDGWFAGLRRRRDDAASRFLLYSLESLDKAYTEGRDESNFVHGRVQPQHFVTFWPLAKEKLLAKCSRALPSSLPMGIQSCHAWSHRIEDKRRLKFLNAHGSLTGVWSRAHQLKDRRVSALETTHLTVHADLSKPTPVGEDDIAIPLLAETEVSYSHKDFNGWRISYRMNFPEDVEMTTIVNRLSRKSKVYSHLRPAADVQVRHASASAIELASDRTAAKRKKASTAVAAVAAGAPAMAAACAAAPST
jgi:hypothetical protein